MQSKHVLLAIFVAAFIQGAIAIIFENAQSPTKDILYWVPLVANAFLFFTWVQVDSVQRSYKPSTALKLGVVALAVAFIPVYLVKSRSKGERLKALGRFLLAGIAFFFFAAMGVALAIAFGSN